MLLEEAVLMLTLWVLTFDPKAKPLVVNWIWQIMATCSCDALILNLPLHVYICISFWKYWISKRCQWSEKMVLSASCTICLLKALHIMNSTKVQNPRRYSDAHSA